MKLYDKDGIGISALDMNYGQEVSSNTIKHATSRTLNFNLNGIDSLNFSIYLDDPMALQIKRLRTFIKVWRSVYDDSGATIYSDPSDEPIFAGVVGGTLKSGQENLMSINCYSPLWRLQSRFHILNHYLKTNTDTDEEYTQSELMWKLIDLVNNAFGLANSDTGITQGTFSSGNDPTVAPFFVAKGSNTWTNIFEEIMNRAGGVDIIPVYKHTDASSELMEFHTDEKRGDDISATMDFRYHTGTDDNLDGCSEEESPNPGEFANYLWAVGAGGPNSGKVALEENIDDDEDGYENIGIYMRRADFPDIKLIGSAGPPKTHLRAIAEAEFAQSRVPKTNYEVTVSPAGGVYYKSDFQLGDVVMLNANKGALFVEDKKQRIYETSLSISDNNVETVSLLLADDFTGKVAV
jgi:hypothetical protein